LGASAQEPELHGEPVEIDVGAAGSQRAPAAQSTVVDATRFGGEVRSVSELLLSAPGVTVHALGGPGQAATFSLRGASADQSLVLLDGIPLQGPGGGAVDLATLPASLLERLVVSRGVLGAQFGAGALGGAVELLPRTARGSASGGAQVSAGSFGTAQVAADAAAPFGSGSALVALQLDRTAGNFDFARQSTPSIPDSPYFADVRENADALRGSAIARVARRLSADSELDILLQGSAGERGLPGPATNPNRLRPRELDQGGVAGLRLRHILGDSTLSLRVWGRVDRLELRGQSLQGFGECQDGAPDCPRIGQRSSAARAEVEYGRPLPAEQWLKASFSAGEDFIVGDETGLRRRTIASAALSDEVPLASRNISLHPAVRFDSVGGQLGLSPALAVLARPWPASPVELRAGWGLSFRPPSFSELYLDQGGISPNPALRPERAWSIDAGAGWRSERLTVSAGLFWSSYRDLIVYQLFPPAKVKPFNVGNARIAGAELQIILTLPAGFFAEGSYSFLQARDLTPGASQDQPLAYRPPHRLFLRVARRGDRLEGYAETSFTSAMPRNQYGSSFQGSQFLLNAGLGARAYGPLWLDLEAKNLLDDRTLQDFFQYPLPGFSLAVIARARL